MNRFQSPSIEKRNTLAEKNRFLQLGFTVIFVLAVAVVPSIATIKFFLI